VTRDLHELSERLAEHWVAEAVFVREVIETLFTAALLVQGGADSSLPSPASLQAPIDRARTLFLAADAS